MAWDCGLRYVFSVSPALQQGPGAASRDREDISRMEMVQRLAKDGCRLLHSPLRQAERPAEPLSDAAVRVCVRERSRERLQLQRTTSRSLSSFDEEDSSDSSLSHRYTGVPATPEKVLEHLLSHLRLDEDCGSLQAREAETLLDDFLLTYPVIMSTSDLCQALLGHYCLKRGRMKDEGKESLVRKRKVLHLLSEWSALCRATLQEDQHTRLFMKTLYGNVLDDLYEFPSLEKELKDLQKLLRMQRRHTVDECSPQRKNKALFHQLSLKENWQPLRAPQTEGKEVLCRVYVTVDSYVSVRTHSAVTAQELLAAVADRLDCAEDDMVLVAVSYSREKALLQPHQCVYTNSLSTAGRLCVCRRDMTDLMSPVPDNAQLQQLAARMLTMNTWDIAVALTNCDWSLFSNLQEQELVYFTLSRDSCAGHTVALELLLQRCNEVQQWVMTEVLLCPVLCKRVQLFKKFIKIAAHCKAQRNLNSFFAIIMGLNTAAVSRLSQTWEKVPGKFKKLFSELESLTDPSFNHKAYRDAFKKMKSPKIPFLPLLLKDITFIHEGNKTFLDNLVNFEKMHMIADTVRIVRQCQTDHMGNMLTQKESAEVRAYINYLHIIDNQQTLFELSHRLEPKV
ncbi:rap guanine nucleotide exchange factor 5b isoform X4 [Electrophorus electricus]|uniref:rap guanine nucleotide exchange factor 5b isoform X4 n=1 Tax=Electrophorus electricus TaxID=8005 RepID=UPI0015D0B03B|nr:rap guanine nucleotide exchange factor 5b isoform X4 [Electrophorus electricus]